MTVVTVVVTCFIQYSAGFMFLCFFQLDLMIMVYNCDVSGGPRQWSGWYLRFDLGRRIPEVFFNDTSIEHNLCIKVFEISCGSCGYQGGPLPLAPACHCFAGHLFTTWTLEL